MAIEIHQGFKRTITYTYTKADGTPGAIDGIPEFSTSNPEVVDLVPSLDGLSVDVVWNGVGTGVTVTATADGDLGTGVFTIVTTDTFDLVAPLGATAGSSTVSDEVAIDAVVLE